MNCVIVPGTTWIPCSIYVYFPVHPAAFFVLR